MFYNETSGTNLLCIGFDGLIILVYGTLTKKKKNLSIISNTSITRKNDYKTEVSLQC